MYCVIQEVKIKKIPPGEPKEIEVYESTWTIGGQTTTSYGYRMSNERYERPIDKAYRITIHQSYRENGKIKKKQCYICTMGYYDVIDYSDWVKDYIRGDRWVKALEQLGISEDELIDLVYSKLNPLTQQIQSKFEQTEEYRAKEEHKRILDEYKQRIEEFAKEYEVERSEYKKCFDVFGELRNPVYLEKIKREYRSRKEYEERSRSYYEDYYSNYNTGSGSSTGSSYNDLFHGNYKEEDKGILKQFYRELSKKFHPDANPEADTSKQMQLLNQLKSEWGI